MISMLAADVQPQLLQVQIMQLPSFMTQVPYIFHQIVKKFIRPRIALRKLLPPPPWSSETISEKAKRVQEELITEAKMARRRSRRNGVSVFAASL
jgi:hypothetical protein